jgi:acetyl-CoA/propionyl-CoA carboxylase carboxyl transferase subunit
MHMDQNTLAPNPGQRDPISRLIRLFDPVPLTFLHPLDDSGVSTARGRMGGERAFAFCTDMRVMGGALGASGCLWVPKTYATSRYS